MAASDPVDDAAAREAALVEAEKIERTEVEDFGAFWSAVDRKGVVLRNVFGVDVELAPALPLRFEVEARKAQDSREEADTRRLVGVLFGETALDTWTAAGMDLEQFSVMLMWGTANTRSPGSMTLAEARKIFHDNAADLGKDEPPTPPVTSSGGRSGSTGPRSKRTSAASTASRRKS